MLENYEFKTTFWMDFSIADRFGIAAIKDTFKRAFDEWKNNVEYLTELVIVLNWKIWDHYEKGHMEIAKVYDSIYWKARDFALDNLKGDDLNYYYRMTD